MLAYVSSLLWCSSSQGSRFASTVEFFHENIQKAFVSNTKSSGSTDPWIQPTLPIQRRNNHTTEQEELIPSLYKLEKKEDQRTVQNFRIILRQNVGGTSLRDEAPHSTG